MQLSRRNNLAATILTIALAGAALTPHKGRAAEEAFEVTGWIPYWKAVEGIESVLPHLDLFTEINPFVYTVKEDGSIFNTVLFTESSWIRLRAETAAKGVRFIPTFMWANPDAIETVLSDPARRQAHIRAIASEVYMHNLDGVDIDYEGKFARTRLHFSAFLEELQEAIGYNKWVMCTIEARTPLDSRYSTMEAIPTDIEYANDFEDIGKHCDRVRIMSYDQGRIDLTLNDANGDPYAPVADIRWVEKVMRLASADIPARKLLIGVPTYGHEYDMFAALDGSGEIEYSQLWSFNPNHALENAARLDITPSRSSAGELTVVFPAEKSLESIPLPFATRVLSWSDAEAISSKATLAATLGVKGISIFKLDGGHDPALFDALARIPAVEKNIVKVGVASELVDAGRTLPSESEHASAPVAVVPEHDLELDATGEDVRALQRILNAIGFSVAGSGPGSPGNETMIFGYATEAALIKFQKARGITPAAGFYGPKTRGALRVSVAVASVPPAAPAPAEITFTRNLELGAKGEDVRMLQKLLNSLGFAVASHGGGSPGNETTFFGPATRSALIKFQKSKGVTPAAGYFGPMTRAAVGRALD